MPAPTVDQVIMSINNVIDYRQNKEGYLDLYELHDMVNDDLTRRGLPDASGDLVEEAKFTQSERAFFGDPGPSLIPLPRYSGKSGRDNHRVTTITEEYDSGVETRRLYLERRMNAWRGSYSNLGTMRKQLREMIVFKERDLRRPMNPEERQANILSLNSLRATLASISVSVDLVDNERRYHSG